jgi:hypothetical protein
MADAKERPRSGRPKARGTGAEADGSEGLRRESEDLIRAMKSGNEVG